MSQPQHMVALARANEVKLARCKVKRDLYSGRLSLSGALEHEYMQTATVFDVLCAQRRWGPTRARKALTMASGLTGAPHSMPEMKRVEDLTDRQKQALLEACGENERSAA